MQRTGTFRTLLFGLASMGMVLPGSTSMAAQVDSPRRPPVITRAVPRDVTLHAGGALVGRVVDAGGVPRAGQSVMLRHGGLDVAKVTTDRLGYFQIRGLRGGTYEALCAESRAICRAWTPGTAPPAAGMAVTLVVGGPPVRGQSGPMGYWLGKPWIVAGVVAAAVAVPIAIHNRRVRETSSP